MALLTSSSVSVLPFSINFHHLIESHWAKRILDKSYPISWPAGQWAPQQHVGWWHRSQGDLYQDPGAKIIIDHHACLLAHLHQNLTWSSLIAKIFPDFMPCNWWILDLMIKWTPGRFLIIWDFKFSLEMVDSLVWRIALLYGPVLVNGGYTNFIQFQLFVNPVNQSGWFPTL